MNVEWWGGSQARLLPSATRRSVQLGAPYNSALRCKAAICCGRASLLGWAYLLGGWALAG